MIDYLYQIGSSSINKLDPILLNFDPSLFQNIILGILAIFIPFAIVFLSDILGSKKDRNELGKMVLNDEILGTKKVFWLSVIGIVFFSFFAGKDISILLKIISLLSGFAFIIAFWSPFRKILRFSEGNISEFEVSFLKKLKFSKFPKYRNKSKAEKMVRAWNSFWSEKSVLNEREYSEINITHIDSAIKKRYLEFAVQLSQAFLNNIEKRDYFTVGYDFLPRILDWNEIFWNEQQRWLKNYKIEKKISNFFSDKYFPTFKKIALVIFKKLYLQSEHFWNWHFFQNKFFQGAIDKLLIDDLGSYQLFECFKKHIEKCEEKLDKISDETKKEIYWSYIKGVISSFTSVFFEKISKSPSNYTIWERYFPNEWKITSSNFEKRISRFILYEFLQWAHQRIFNNRDSLEFDKDLTEVINGIFPNIHQALFPSFLMIYYLNDVKYVIKKEQTFYILGTSVSWVGEGGDQQIDKIMQQKNESEKEETINIIYKYFWEWRVLRVFKEDISEEEALNWKEYPETKRKEITNRTRDIKINNIKAELESDETIEMCKEDQKYEYRRKDLIDLMNELLKHLPE